jgi:hypothetical protein
LVVAKKGKTMIATRCPTCQKPINDDAKEFVFRNECPWCGSPLDIPIEPEVVFQELPNFPLIASARAAWQPPTNGVFCPDPPPEPKPSQLKQEFVEDAKAVGRYLIAGMIALLWLVGIVLGVILFGPYLTIPVAAILVFVIWLGGKLNRLIRAIEKQNALTNGKKE